MMSLSWLSRMTFNHWEENVTLWNSICKTSCYETIAFTTIFSTQHTREDERHYKTEPSIPNPAVADGSKSFEIFHNRTNSATVLSLSFIPPFKSEPFHAHVASLFRQRKCIQILWDIWVQIKSDKLAWSELATICETKNSDWITMDSILTHLIYNNNATKCVSPSQIIPVQVYHCYVSNLFCNSVY